MTTDWLKADPSQAKKIMATLNDHIKPVAFDADKTTVRFRGLPFYKNVKFYELTDLTAVPAARKYALADDKNVYMINWTNGPIYEVNENTPIELTPQNVADYVRFFFSYVRGRHGRFIVVENFEDIKWQNEPPAQGRKVMQDILHPVSLIAEDQDGTFTLEAFMLFKDSLFRTLIHVKKDGNVDMSDEELKIEGMPVVQDVMMA